MKIAISDKAKDMMDHSSWIRRMFDEGARLKAELGEENVFDFTLGNPVGEPPAEVKEELERIARENRPGAHRYMPNAGLLDARESVAGHLSGRTGLSFSAENIIMTCGAGGALNVIIKALVDPGDEIIITEPYFAEYLFYADNHQAICKVVPTDNKFRLIPGKIKEAIGPKTRAVLLNSPNNPTGAVYSEEALKKVGKILAKASDKYKRPIFLIMDEPYRKIVYQGVSVPDVFHSYRHTIVATSHSKDLRIPGERIGYIAIHPEEENAKLLIGAMTLANRILGFVNAPAFMQRVVSKLQEVEPDMSVYTKNLETLFLGLKKIGYEMVKPGGGFYLFPKTPIDDDNKFISALKNQNILVVPGAGFGRSGHFRIAFCTEPETCERALEGFAKAFEQAAAARKPSRFKSMFGAG